MEHVGHLPAQVLANPPMLKAGLHHLWHQWWTAYPPKFQPLLNCVNWSEYQERGLELDVTVPLAYEQTEKH